MFPALEPVEPLVAVEPPATGVVAPEVDPAATAGALLVVVDVADPLEVVVPVVGTPPTEVEAAAPPVSVALAAAGPVVAVPTDVTVPTLVGVSIPAATAVGPEVAAAGPVNSGAAGCRPVAPSMITATMSSGTSPTAGTSHHHRHAGARIPRLDRTACVVRRGWGGR
ncbi:MAG: hypothetical protein JO057_09890 [Chloroflexi bacterium]|nr:hypothetical protein [Chloroflexota bacterium]